MKLCVLLVCVLGYVGSHSWMSCPASLDTRPNRGGNTGKPNNNNSLTNNDIFVGVICRHSRTVILRVKVRPTVGPCEREGGKRTVTDVSAGDRLKVGWTSNNHAGGYVRLAIVPEGISYY